MNESDPFDDHPLLRVFSFAGWEEDAVSSTPIAFADKWIEEYRLRAQSCDKLSMLQQARENDEKAVWWDSLLLLPPEVGKSMDFALRESTREFIDALLERARVSEDATAHLMALAEQIFTGLCILAVHDNKQAAKSLVNSLSYIVDGFNDIAHDRPEAFLHATRRNQGIPGIITREPLIKAVVVSGSLWVASFCRLSATMISGVLCAEAGFRGVRGEGGWL